jgi:hypothetical protein
MTGFYTRLALALIQCGACETALDISEEMRGGTPEGTPLPCKPLSRSDRCVTSRPWRRDASKSRPLPKRRAHSLRQLQIRCLEADPCGGVDTNALTSAAFVPESTMRFTHPRRTNP